MCGSIAGRADVASSLSSSSSSVVCTCRGTTDKVGKEGAGGGRGFHNACRGTLSFGGQSFITGKGKGLPDGLSMVCFR